MLLERAIEISYETVRSWCKTWGPIFARTIRRNRGCPFKDKWHIDEMRIKIKGEIFCLWCLIDSDGEEIEILLQRRHNAKAAIRFLKRVLKNLGVFPKSNDYRQAQKLQESTSYFV